MRNFFHRNLLLLVVVDRPNGYCFHQAVVLLPMLDKYGDLNKQGDCHAQHHGNDQFLVASDQSLEGFLGALRQLFRHAALLSNAVQSLQYSALLIMRPHSPPQPPIDQTDNPIPIPSQQSLQTNKHQKVILRLLSNGQSLFSENSTEPQIRRHLMDTHHIYSKYVGVGSSSKNMAEFVASPCLLDRYATRYLLSNGICQATKLRQIEWSCEQEMRWKIFQHYTKVSKCWLVDAHKFGADFLLYEKNPDNHHASALLFIELDERQHKSHKLQIDPQQQQIQSDKQVNMMRSRLAGVCKKKPIVVKLNPKTQQITQRQIPIQKPQSNRIRTNKPRRRQVTDCREKQ